MTAGSSPAAPAKFGGDKRNGFSGRTFPDPRVKTMNKFGKFISEVKLELKKVSWSTRRELINSTIVVISSVIVLTVFISICDLIWSTTINFILR